MLVEIDGVEDEPKPGGVFGTDCTNCVTLNGTFVLGPVTTTVDGECIWRLCIPYPDDFCNWNGNTNDSGYIVISLTAGPAWSLGIGYTEGEDCPGVTEYSLLSAIGPIDLNLVLCDVVNYELEVDIAAPFICDTNAATVFITTL
jgi:hypothetical protein